MKRLVLTLGVMALTAILLTRTASAHTSCSGTISGVTIHGGITVTGDCVLKNVTVTGGIDMAAGTLQVCDSTIKGNIDITGGTCVAFGLDTDDTFPGAACSPDLINGRVDVSNVIGPPANCPGRSNVEAFGGTINGSVTWTNNGPVELEKDFLNGSVKLFNNSGVGKIKAIEVDANSINGSLFCSDNTSGVGFGNTVTGSAKDQCADARTTFSF